MDDGPMRRSEVSVFATLAGAAASDPKVGLIVTWVIVDAIGIAIVLLVVATGRKKR